MGEGRTTRCLVGAVAERSEPASSTAWVCSVGHLTAGVGALLVFFISDTKTMTLSQPGS